MLRQRLGGGSGGNEAVKVEDTAAVDDILLGGGGGGGGEAEPNNNRAEEAWRSVGGWGERWGEGQTPSGGGGRGALAFSVENILAPGRFCKAEEDSGRYGQ